MQTIIQDLRYAIRTMAKRPGFTLVAALTLALGIGANSTIFSAVNAVLLKPLPFPESEQLVDLSETFKPNGYGSVSVPNFEDWKNQNDVFTGIAAYQFRSFNLQSSDTPQRIPGISVSANYFDVLGVKPTLGRTCPIDEPGDRKHCARQEYEHDPPDSICRSFTSARLNRCLWSHELHSRAAYT